MTVSELIEALQKCPPEKEVSLYYISQQIGWDKFYGPQYIKKDDKVVIEW